MERIRWMLPVVAALGCGADRPPSPAAAGEARPQLAPPTVTHDSLSSPTIAEVSQLVSQRWAFDLDSMVKRRVITRPRRVQQDVVLRGSGRLRGASYEAVEEFERTLNIAVLHSLK